MTWGPMVVTAELAAGLAHTGPWGIALDGLLASVMWEQTKANLIASGAYDTRVRDQSEVPDLDLPLARCHRDPGMWHWAATFSLPRDASDTPEVSWWTGAYDARDTELVASRMTRRVDRSSGPYRTRRMPLLVTLCPRVTWRAVGDTQAVADLLEDIPAIGKKRSAGHGHVLSWTVEHTPEVDEHAAAHLHPDGTLGRPCPPACTQGDHPTGLAGLRPPYTHAARQRTLHLPQALP